MKETELNQSQDFNQLEPNTPQSNKFVSMETIEQPNSSESGAVKNEHVFRTRIDAWLVILVGIAIASCSVQAWSLRIVSPGGSIAAAAIGILSLVTVLTLTVPCRYTLKDDHLFIQCGVTRKRIPYAQIHGVEASSCPLSAPALSLRRVKIVHGRSFQLVSPQERGRFIEELSKRAGLLG